MLGLDFVAKAPPDGYIIAAGQGGNLTVLPHTSKNIPYDPLKDFVRSRSPRRTTSASSPIPTCPFKSVAEMIAWPRPIPAS